MTFSQIKIGQFFTRLDYYLDGRHEPLFIKTDDTSYFSFSFNRTVIVASLECKDFIVTHNNLYDYRGSVINKYSNQNY